MRVLRVMVGTLTLLLAIPVLIAGAVAWWTMQHRSADGAFHADLAPIEAVGRVVIVPDIDAVLRRDAPIARADQTTMRVQANGFVGVATPADIAAYLAGAGYTELQGVTLRKGPLVLQTRDVAGSGQALADPRKQDFWIRRGAGEISWSPGQDRGRQLALVVVGSPGTEPIQIEAAVTTEWLNSTTWGLLILGPVLLMLGLAAIAWPQRPREIVYVMDAAAAVQAGLPAPGPHSPAPALLPVNATYQPVRAYTPLVQSSPPDAELNWPPAEPVDETPDATEVAERPMPVAGMHLHLTQRASTSVDEHAGQSADSRS